ncbi:MAG: transposase zinc-binding domain-containing protein [Pyrinomonadaceae bacterium]|nr:transposase zinc-binding domain-containing protein [Pyrinomonadaceae bacterium]
MEIADIFRQHGEAYRLTHGATLLPEQRRVMRAIEECRTAALGAHVDECDSCGNRLISYNSCRNRHCPKCQSLASAQWVAERQADLLPVDYFHVVFTVPQELAPLSLWTSRPTCMLLLFMASLLGDGTVLRFLEHPKHHPRRAKDKPLSVNHYV